MPDASTIKNHLEKAIDDLALHPELFANNPDKDFTRCRKISVRDVLRFPILMERDSVDMELLKYYDYGPDATPTQSAYIQQRSKLAPDTFKLILDRFNKTLSVSTYLGKYVLYGVDGSGFNIFFNPNDPDTYNPPSGKSKLGNNEIHVVASYRLTDLIFTNAIIQPCRRKNEYSAVCDLIDNSSFDGGIPLFIMDRGFPSFNMFSHAKEKGVFYLSRAKDLYIERLLKNDMPTGTDEFDLTVERIIIRSQSQKHRSQPDNPDIYRYVDRNTKFDYIEPASSDEYPLTIRVVRLKIGEGQYENLVTNLPADEFDADALRALYYTRWGIETAFSYLKHAIGAIDFHCKTFENIIHEVWARLILFNCCSAITALAVPKQPEDSDFVYKVNFTMAFKNSHTFLRQKESSQIIGDIIALIERYLCPIRPERYFERRHRFQSPLKFSYRH